ncbi:MAG: SAM-dependent methyltransferase [Ignavibacteriae bacterium HGW-Ignavibacteriae-2]|jgi:cyclopropane-fatty-acyl-phospholipid synthase|nr:MAG: SAM-dependent methyltransferase [Ignavibacteriae bacterium HGW-Ignavibacteriae-2]
MKFDNLLTRNLLPDFLIRFGIKNLLKARLRNEKKSSVEEQRKSFMELVAQLKESKIAVNTPDANEQHYEVPTEFFKLVLGTNLKYSSGYWDKGIKSLDDAEKKMLQITCERAGVRNNEDILELGCGWGSLTLFMAQKYPDSKITAVSNSKTQKEYIDYEAARRGFKNILVVTADINDFQTEKNFDRIVSVEMFEHMRNYTALFEKIFNLLKPEGELFVHIFAHNKYAYLFEIIDDTDWMAKYFFTGGIMPSDHLLFYFSDDFQTKNHWIVNGTHYQKTANAWLSNMDANKDKILQLFAKTYGEENKIKWWVYWRVFFMSCAELWGFKNGDEWFVSHYLFKKRKQC